MKNEAECICPTCPNLRRPVCASDGVQDLSECHLRRQACLADMVVFPAKRGPCGRFLIDSQLTLTTSYGKIKIILFVCLFVCFSVCLFACLFCCHSCFCSSCSYYYSFLFLLFSLGVRVRPSVNWHFVSIRFE